MNPFRERTTRRPACLMLLAAALMLGWSTIPAVERARPEKRAASHLKLAHSLYMAGRYSEALASVERALDEEPKYVQAHQMRGMILFSMDAVEEALAAFDRTLALDRGYTEARNWRGSALVQLKRFDEALETWQEALKDRTYTTPEMLHTNIGRLHRMQGRREQALEHLRKAVSLNSSYARGFYELGLTYEEMGQQKEALRAYQDALVGMDEDADLNLRLGLALARSGDRPKAKAHFEKVLRLQPDGPQAVQARDEIRKLQPRS